MKYQSWDRIVGRAVASCLLVLVPLAAASWLSPNVAASTSGVTFNSLLASFDGPAATEVKNDAASDLVTVLDDWTYTSKKMQSMWGGFVQQHNGKFDFNKGNNSQNKGNFGANKFNNSQVHHNSNQFGSIQFGHNKGHNSQVDHKSVQFAHFQVSKGRGFNHQEKQQVQHFARHLVHEVVTFFNHSQNRKGVQAFEQHLVRQLKSFVVQERHEKKAFQVVMHEQKDHVKNKVPMSACMP